MADEITPPAPVRTIVERVLGPMLPDGWDDQLAPRGRDLTLDEDIDCARIAAQIRKDAGLARRNEYLAALFDRWQECDRTSRGDDGRWTSTSIGDFSTKAQAWKQTPSFEQLIQEAARRAVAVVFSRELLMPAWAMAAILAAAPPDARLVTFHQEWTTLENVLVFHSALFPEVPEGVRPPMLNASWDTDRQVVHVAWPIRADYFEGGSES